MKLDRYIDDAKNKLSLKSDSELSLYLGFSRGAVNAWRKQKSCLDGYSAFMLADILEIDPRILISNIRFEYENDTNKKEFWDNKIKEYGFISISYNLFLLCSSLIIYILC